MMNKVLWRAAFLAVLVGWAAVLVLANAPAKPPVEMTVKLGETADCGRGLAITFEDVPEDSRCPVGATCVWAGNARVVLGVRQSGGEALRVELNTNRGSRSAAVLGFTVELVDLSPTRKMGEELDRRAYVVTLGVTGAAS